VDDLKQCQYGDDEKHHRVLADVVNSSLRRLAKPAFA
jgi:hypothetical protein